jgi:hypothetical protein
MAPSRNGRRSLSDKAAKLAKSLLNPASDNEEDHELASRAEILAEFALAAAIEAGDEVPLTDAGVTAPLVDPPIGDGLDGTGLVVVAAFGGWDSCCWCGINACPS